MSEEEIGGILRGICDDFTAAELADDTLMLRELKELLGLKRPLLKPLLRGAREMKLLRGDIPPYWIPFVLSH